MNNSSNDDDKDDTGRNNHHPPPPSSVASADAADKLGKAIMFMIAAYLNDNLVGRAEVVNLLEDLIHKVEAEKKGPR